MPYYFSLLLFIISAASSATVRSFPNFNYGGQSHTEFLQGAIERSSPSNARILAELFGGLELGMELGSGTQAVISVGGAATRCQHQSPCFDSHCQLCYDPLLRIHGKCGGASYFTCRGTLPKSCLPYTCTAPASSANKDTVLLKKFPRFEDPFCLGIEERARSLEMTQRQMRRMNITSAGSGAQNGSGSPLSRMDTASGLAAMAASVVRDPELPDWILSVPDAVTQCQGYDLCLDLRCGTCYDSYLGAHTKCGKLTYYDCNVQLPRECQPVICTETDINEIFSNHDSENQEGEPRMMPDLGSSSLMVRNFKPLEGDRQLCI